MNQKKPILQPLLAYAGKRNVLTYLSLVISGIRQLLALGFALRMVLDVVLG